MATKPTAAPSGPTIPASKVELMTEAIDQAYVKVLRLEAMLVNTCGDASDSFHNMADSLKENYLGACADFAFDIKTALEKSFDDAGSPS